MRPRERVLAALKQEKPDRVPIFETWVDGAMASALGYDDVQGACVGLGLDCIMIPERIPPDSGAWGTGVDEWGRVWQGGFYVDGVVETYADIARYSPPLDRVEKFFDAPKTAEVMSLYPDHCFTWGSHLAPFTMAYMSMGFERFFLRLHDDPAFVHALLEARLEWCLAMFKKAVALGVDVVILGDDLGHNEGSMVSPAMWREFILPYHRRVVDALDVPVILHSDGGVVSCLPMVVEAGFVGFHGLEPAAGIDLGAVKREFGRDLALIGNADVRLLFEDDPEAVRRDVERCMEQGNADGSGTGYMFASCNSIFDGLNAAAVAGMYRHAAAMGAL